MRVTHLYLDRKEACSIGNGSGAVVGEGDVRRSTGEIDCPFDGKRADLGTLPPDLDFVLPCTQRHRHIHVARAPRLDRVHPCPDLHTGDEVSVDVQIDHIGERSLDHHRDLVPLHKHASRKREQDHFSARRRWKIRHNHAWFLSLRCARN